MFWHHDLSSLVPRNQPPWVPHTCTGGSLCSSTAEGGGWEPPKAMGGRKHPCRLPCPALHLEGGWLCNVFCWLTRTSHAHGLRAESVSVLSGERWRKLLLHLDGLGCSASTSGISEITRSRSLTFPAAVQTPWEHFPAAPGQPFVQIFLSSTRKEYDIQHQHPPAPTEITPGWGLGSLNEECLPLLKTWLWALSPCSTRQSSCSASSEFEGKGPRPSRLSALGARWGTQLNTPTGQHSLLHLFLSVYQPADLGVESCCPSAENSMSSTATKGTRSSWGRYAGKYQRGGLFLCDNFIQGLFVPCTDTEADSFQFRSRRVGRKEITQSGSCVLASEQHSCSGALRRPAACERFPSWWHRQSLLVAESPPSSPRGAHSCTYLWCNIMVMQCWLSHFALMAPRSSLRKQKPRWSPATASESPAIFSQPSFPEPVLLLLAPEVSSEHSPPPCGSAGAQICPSLCSEGSWQGTKTRAARCTCAPEWCRLCWDVQWCLRGSLHLWAPRLPGSP